MEECDRTKHELEYLTAVNPEAMETERCRAKGADAKGNHLKLSQEDVLHCADGILAVCKPCGVYVDHVRDAATKWYLSKRKGQDVRESCSQTASDDRVSGSRTGSSSKDRAHRHQEESTFVQLVHRLDRDTSGVLLLATSRAASKSLHRAFNLGQATKTYVCMCSGIQPTWQQMTVETGHGRSKHGLWRVYDKNDIGRQLPGGGRIRRACTHFHVESVATEERQESGSGAVRGMQTTASVPIGRIRCPEEGRAFWVRLRARPVTGRTHQIRLHCAYLGLPIAGDLKYYGAAIDRRGEPLAHHLLHAESLALPHPFRCTEQVNLSARRPPWAEHGL